MKTLGLKMFMLCLPRRLKMFMEFEIVHAVSSQITNRNTAIFQHRRKYAPQHHYLENQQCWKVILIIWVVSSQESVHVHGEWNCSCCVFTEELSPIPVSSSFLSRASNTVLTVLWHKILICWMFLWCCNLSLLCSMLTLPVWFHQPVPRSQATHNHHHQDI